MTATCEHCQHWRALSDTSAIGRCREIALFPKRRTGYLTSYAATCDNVVPREQSGTAREAPSEASTDVERVQPAAQLFSASTP